MPLPSPIRHSCQSVQSVSAAAPPIPTGLPPSAQGCEARATLGHAPQYFPQPQRGCIHPVRAHGGVSQNCVYIGEPKRQGTGALQDAGAPSQASENAKRLGVRLSSTAFEATRKANAIPRHHTSYNPVGVDDMLFRLPRVASRTRRPWAGGRYPVGVDPLAEIRQLVTNCHLLKAGCRSTSQLVTKCNQLKTACVFIAQPLTNCYRLKPPTAP